MKFFFPDSMDLVDPNFDFENDEHLPHRIRYRDDIYAHEIFEVPPYDGLLLSKAVVDGFGGKVGQFSNSQRDLFENLKMRKFYRLDGKPETSRLETMGDCGAFSYVNDHVPPYKDDEAIDFYENAGFDYGVSIDHIITSFDKDNTDSLIPALEMDAVDADVDAEWRRRQDITLDNAQSFRKKCYTNKNKKKTKFEPIGIVQAWSPRSYADAFLKIQKMGYTYIALGGLVPLKSTEIVSVLTAIDDVRKSTTRIHLFGVTRGEYLKDFSRLGVTSFDSTAPLRRAFMDDRKNYYTPKSEAYTAIRIPHAGSSPKLKRRISSGQVDQNKARRLERESMGALIQFGKDGKGLDRTLDAIMDFSQLCDPNKDYYQAYKRVLDEKPWESCSCNICKDIGIHVMIFRGAERNRRRGFHNLYVFEQQLRKQI